MGESTIDAETWRVVPRHSSYEVSTLGRVRRCKSGRGAAVGRLLKASIDSGGYLQVGSTRGALRVHVLVAEAFIGAIPQGGEVHHINRDRSDARLANLEVAPSRWAHRERHRTHNSGRRRDGEGNPLVACACGCGEMFRRFDTGGRPRKFVSGHNGHVREMPTARSAA